MIFDWELKLIRMDLNSSHGPDHWQNRDSCIALYFSGLFSFYQYSKFGVKKNFLTLVKDKMLEMKKELILSLPGFMLCMLPALDENLALQQDVKDIL